MSGYSVALGGVGNFAQEKGEGVDVCQRDGGTVGMGYKKARRACTVRALRTSSDDSGNHRWRILVELAESDTKY